MRALLPPTTSTGSHGAFGTGSGQQGQAAANKAKDRKKRRVVSGGDEAMEDVEALAVVSEGGGKKDAKKGGDPQFKLEKGTRQLRATLAKSVLQLQQQQQQQQQQQRTLAGALLDVLILAADSPEVTAMSSQGATYSSAARESRDHNLGSPHLWVWGGLVAALAERSDIGAKNQQDIKAYLAVLEAQRLEEKGEDIKVCRVEKTYKGETKRLLLCLSHERADVRSVVISSLQQTGGMVKQGRAPPGALERELQEWLTAMYK